MSAEIANYVILFSSCFIVILCLSEIPTETILKKILCAFAIMWMALYYKTMWTTNKNISQNNPSAKPINNPNKSVLYKQPDERNASGIAKKADNIYGFSDTWKQKIDYYN